MKRETKYPERIQQVSIASGRVTKCKRNTVQTSHFLLLRQSPLQTIVYFPFSQRIHL